MKIVKYSFLVLVVLFLILLAAPFLFKGKIVGLIKDQANTQLNAKLNFNEDISLSLIKNFPHLSLGIQDLSVIGINEFEQDTLFASKDFSVTLDVMSVINGDEIIIKKIRLDQPRIKALVLKNGKANWDIAKADTSAAEVPADTASSPFNLKLNSNSIFISFR